ncbi:PREDICTED: uncharacterized protein LOC109147336 [Ipomoea nil]|uniref:uncharacterized protein LOC109147336 n=1 Tax=Ipomoea nil TaxID=35883 RepID=UPI0009016B1E|nr:PREDICTED: uncharacterized protein LOC109147336 [Ipomoea nil]
MGVIEIPPQLAGFHVAGLIDQDSGSRDISILSDIFIPVDISRILKVHTSPDYDDSCYRTIVGNFAGNIGSFDKWNKLWSLKFLQKWKTFLWRDLSDILPTTKNLIIKRVEVDPLCSMCGINQEDTMHALVLCGFASSVWRKSSLPIPNILTNVFRTWFEEVLDILDSNQMISTTAILYNIWRARNGIVWEHFLPTPKRLVVSSPATRHAWCSVQPNTSRLPLTATASPSPAAVPVRQCWFDAGYQPTMKCATVDAVLLGDDGGFISAFNRRLPYCFSPLMAEALACKEALSWLRGRGKHKVELHTNCLTLQQYLSTNTGPLRSYVGFVIDGCRTFSASFAYCSLKFVPRSANLIAHTLASLTFAQSIAMYWDAIPPDSIAGYL